ncbi:hypothetical protein PIB30_057974 [Stylosanthes scabra]|uniref:Uncharacterized protein n=1 Tax=Stylosanthes scabra TaxID=79078 RepID=A0ABU6SK42_9FABA|nr:hypothetical protein [Stylosanthes scabra]
MGQPEDTVDPHWKAEESMDFDEGFYLIDRKFIFCVPIRWLNIIWGYEKRFWEHPYNIDIYDGLLPEAKMLVQVNWLEVTGKLNIRRRFKRGDDDSVKRYEIFYVVSFNEDAYGWHSAPIKFAVKAGEKALTGISVKYLEEYRKSSVHGGGEWHEIPGGQFSVSEDAEYVEFGMYEVESAWWKGGMHLAGVIIKAADVHDDRI